MVRINCTKFPKSTDPKAQTIKNPLDKRVCHVSSIQTSKFLSERSTRGSSPGWMLKCFNSSDLTGGQHMATLNWVFVWKPLRDALRRFLFQYLQRSSRASFYDDLVKF